MSTSTTTTPPLEDRIRELVLDELGSLLLDRETLEARLEAGEEARIPSRKAILLMVRVCRALGVGREAIKQQDLKPDQVTSLDNLIQLLARRIGPHVETS